MHGSPSQDFEFSSQHKRVLQELTIREGSPGAILRDFEAILDYLREGELSITSTHQLPLRELSEIKVKSQICCKSNGMSQAAFGSEYPEGGCGISPSSFRS